MVWVEVREKWLYFVDTVPFRVGVPFAEKSGAFAQPLSEFFRQEYPKLLAGGAEIFWLTTFTAVLESGTHPTDEVNAAFAQLKAKYAGKGAG